MRTLRIIMAGFVLALPVRAEVSRSTSTLQEITRDAQERLRQWDEADVQEQAAQAKYWWLGLLELALSLTFGRTAFSGQGLTFSEKGGPSIRPTKTVSRDPSTKSN